jgi:acetolactate synthase-1/2/3 large subunit
VNNAELIVAICRQAGITHGFGIPSGNVLPLMEAMRSGGLEFVLTAHEGSAGFAADVTGRLTGIPGLCIATLGPGATNLATGVGNAWLDRSPMLAITCNLNTDQLGRRIQMYIDHHALFAPITKATLALRNGNIAETMREAIEIAISEPMGPVHLDLPEDVALALTTEAIPALSVAQPLPKAQPGSLQKAAEVLRSAKRPIAVLGSSAMRIADHAVLSAFLERHSIPFMTTTMAKGLVDDGHELALGCIERSRRQFQRNMVANADLIIGVGYDTIEVEFEVWIGNVPLLQLDIEPVDIAPSVNLLHEVTGELQSTLTALTELPTIENDWTVEELDRHRQEFNRLLRPVSPGFTAHEAIDTVRAALPRDGILCYDVGAHTHQIASQWMAPGPRQLLITNGWSSMGFGLPSAIAAKISMPDRPVICLIGDGCFQMTCGELATARRLGITLPVVVLDDRWLSLIRIKQAKRQYGVSGIELRPDPYDTPPEHYFGVPAFGVRDASALDERIKTALAADGPTVVEAIVNSDHYFDTVFD